MIEIKNLTRVFKNDTGIKNVSFNINDQDIIAFVGDNGAGKTTTIKAIFGELHLKEGEILINNENLFINNNLQKLAFFPDTNNIPLDMKLHEYILFLCAANGINKKQLENKIKNIYEMLDLNKFKNKKIKELSAGWKKKAIMASVLVRSPKYIILDEPTANLDVESKIEFISILKELNKLGVTILITSHIIEELQEIANHLVLIKNGEIVYDKQFDNKKELIINIYKKFIDPKKVNIELISNLYKEDKENEK
ncbi:MULTISPECIES: ABC transporter ATP-binding protein [unclassified Spiroplasma]|uniref:ABC transporter ATP-binding protein n=1 Tax=unclassified Spiroplasma TaxID=2637901 RepID=UPI0030D495F3